MGPVERLDVFDAAGRHVRTLAVSGEASHVFEWDGAGEQGRPVAPGVYVIEATGAGGTRSTRVVRLP